MCDLPRHNRVHVEPDVGGGSGVVPEGQSAVPMKQNADPVNVAQYARHVGCCTEGTNQLAPAVCESLLDDNHYT